MKISKQSNKFSFILVVSFLLTQISFAAEKVDNIWKVIENKDISNEVTKKKKDLNEKEIIQGVKIKLTDENIVVNKELDELRLLSVGGKKWIADLQTSERKRTGIPSLKVGYNKVFGYYLEVTKVHSDKIPNDYIRKQTLVSSERYITPALKDYEEENNL